MSTPAISRDEVADTLDEIALLLEIQGENPFKIRAYRQGAETVRGHDGDIVGLARDNDLEGIKGIGKALREKLHELATTGELEFHRELRDGYPDSFFELFELEGLGPKKIAAVHRELGVESIAALREVCEAGKVANLSGFGAKTEQKILAAIARRETHAGRFHLDTATAAAREILEMLRERPEVLRAESAGSLRRARETVGDLDFIVATAKPADVTRFFAECDLAAEVIAHGDTKCSIRLENGLQCDLRAVSNAQYPFALQYFTGSKEHNVALRSRALKRKLSLNEYGFTGEGDAPEVTDERALYQALGLAFIEPELRENRGEIEAAIDGDLPDLVSWEHLRGTFHNHTTASDGRASLEEMAAAAADLGLAYLGIADHSKSSVQANGLDESRLREQIASIAAWNGNRGDEIRLFAGAEVDILKDGRLDFDDDLLAELDYAVASVHQSFTLDEKSMTRRLVRAMENEYVTMLGHLTGRLLLRRDPCALNHEVIIDCAAETRTVIELNCNPRRLDMDWRWWHRARDKGVLCSINPDAHRPEQLQYLRFGAQVARKGWLRRQDVLNTRDAKAVAAFLETPKAKRRAD